VNKRPFGFTDLSRSVGLDKVIDFIVENGGLAVDQQQRSA
jgi:urease accessory protein